jgi:hypothetical protein
MRKLLLESLEVRELGTPRLRRENNTKMDVRNTGSEGLV